MRLLRSEAGGTPGVLILALSLSILVPGCQDPLEKPEHGSRSNASGVEAFDPSTGNCTTVDDMPYGIWGARCVEASGFLYVVGGLRRCCWRPGNFLRYDPVAEAWEELPDIPSARRNHDVVVVGDVLYVVGGAWAETALETFDIAAGLWTVEPEMPSNHSTCRSVALGGFVYAIGGYDGDVDAFDVVGRTWQGVTTLPSADTCSAAETDGSLIYVIGTDGGGRVWIYDPGLDTWQSGPSMPQHGSYLDSVLVGQEIHVIGEFRENARQVFILDIASLVWSEGIPKRTNRRQVGVARAGGLVYAVGGN